jgi:hypothetical protein
MSRINTTFFSSAEPFQGVLWPAWRSIMIMVMVINIAERDTEPVHDTEAAVSYENVDESDTKG